MKKVVALGSVILGGIIVLVLLINAKMKGPTRNNDRINNNNVNEWWNADVDITPDPDFILDLEIPNNYVPVPGKTETYMVIGEDGTVSAYRKRIKNENGEWIWSDIKDEIPNDYEPVIGQTDVYRKKSDNGTYEYYRYIRNSDGSYAFVKCDEKGNDTVVPSGSEVPRNYKLVTGDDKSAIYAVYDENNVITGYMERYINEDGSYKWRKTTKPEVQKPTQKPTESPTKTPVQKPTEAPTKAEVQKPTEAPTQKPTEAPTQTQNSNTRTETKTTTTSEVKGNYLITYTTTVTYVYDENDVLISTKTEGPVETSRVLVNPNDVLLPDKSLIASTIDAELNRVSSQVTYNEELANQVLALINNDRESAGLPQLTMSKTDSTYKIARIKAADMALYNHSDYDSPMYGDAMALSNRYSLNISYIAESVWKTTEKTANEIHTRFQSNQASRNNRMNQNFTKIGISIVMKNGYYYIYECYAE